MITYFTDLRLGQYYSLVKRLARTILGALFMTSLLICCKHSDITCAISGPTEGLAVNLPFSGNNANTVCNQSAQTKPVTSTGVASTTDRAGTKNTAYQFNGATSLIYMDSLALGANVTMACWLKADNLYQNAVALYYGNPNSDGFGLVMSGGGCVKGNKITVLIGGVTCDLGNSSAMITNANWYHVVLVKRDKTFTLFVNSLPILTTESFFYKPTEQLNIGAHLFVANNNGYFSGAMDEVRVYDRALSTDEVTALFNLN